MDARRRRSAYVDMVKEDNEADAVLAATVGKGDLGAFFVGSLEIRHILRPLLLELHPPRPVAHVPTIEIGSSRKGPVPADLMLEIRHLRSLIALAEAGTVSAAARRVHLTQSALSHQLRAIDAHYGVAAVKRKGQTVELTEAGQRLLALARSVTAAIGDAERDLVRLAGKPSGALRIVLECHTCFDWLMPVMDAFRRNWPEVELDLVSGFHPDPFELLAADRADLVIGSEPGRRRGLVVQPLFRFEIMAVLPTDHPLRARRYLDARDFKGQTLITYPVPGDRIDLIREVLKHAGIRRSAGRGADRRDSSAGGKRRGIAPCPIGASRLHRLRIRHGATHREERLWSDYTRDDEGDRPPWLCDGLQAHQGAVFRDAGRAGAAPGR